MPHIKTTVRRSARKAGNKIPSPQYKHDLFKDPPTVPSKKKKVKKVISGKSINAKKRSTISESASFSEEGECNEEIASHPSKNYSKIELYDRWVKSRNDATDNKKQLVEVEKECRREKKEVEKLKKELIEKFECIEELEDVNLEFKKEIKQLKSNSTSSKKNAKDGKVTQTAMIANMKSTYENLTSKNEFKHKTELCDLQFKYKELELEYKHKELQIARLTDENKELRKNNCSVNELKVASLKSEIQIRSMRDKSMVR